MINHKVKPGKEERRISEDEGLPCTVFSALYTIYLVFLFTKNI